MESFRAPSPRTVVVIGAGLSGLIAARDLVRAGCEVIVLEAAQRVGGRVLSETSSQGSRLDLGGQWIGVGHHRIADLAREHAEPTFRRAVGAFPGIVDGRRRVRWCSPTVIGAVVSASILCAIAALSPKSWSNRRSVDSFLKRFAMGRARGLLRVGAEISWTAQLDRISLYGARRLVRSQHGLGTILAASGGAQDSMLVGGMGALIDRLSDELGDRVRIGERVMTMRNGAEGVVVQTANTTYRASKVIVAMPAPVAAAIDFVPPLPDSIRSAQLSAEMGTVYKAIAVYERPFWRDGSGRDLLYLNGGGGAVFDTSPPGGPGHLCILIGGDSAKQFDALSTGEKVARILGPLAAHYGDAIMAPSSWHDKSWHLDPNVRGGYVALPILGTQDGFWPLDTAPFGNIHWASSETAVEHPGYLDGAIESGCRAAAEVISTFG